jgi:hypothetical protein
MARPRIDDMAAAKASHSSPLTPQAACGPAHAKHSPTSPTVRARSPSRSQGGHMDRIARPGSAF